MAVVDLIMPKLGESIMEATILKWHKKPGDPVKMDETVLDIATGMLAVNHVFRNQLTHAIHFNDLHISSVFVNTQRTGRVNCGRLVFVLQVNGLMHGS